MGRKSPFSVDLKLDVPTTVDGVLGGQATLEHMEATFPMLRKQQEVLKVLVEDQWEHHQKIRNRNKSRGQAFEIGDLVLVRVEVQTIKEKGPGKLRLKARGPFQVFVSNVGLSCELLLFNFNPFQHER